MNNSKKSLISGIVIGILVTVIVVAAVLIVVLLKMEPSSNPAPDAGKLSEQGRAEAGSRDTPGNESVPPENTAAVPENEAAAPENTAVPSESEAAVSEGVAVETELFTVTVPADWVGKVSYQVVKGEYNDYSLEFYHTASREAGMDGFLFAVSLYMEGSEPELPAMKKMGRLILRQAEVYSVIAEYPTDVQYPLEYQEEYQGMRAASDGVIDSFAVKPYYEFQESD